MSSLLTNCLVRLRLHLPPIRGLPHCVLTRPRVQCRYSGTYVPSSFPRRMLRCPWLSAHLEPTIREVGEGTCSPPGTSRSSSSSGSLGWSWFRHFLLLVRMDVIPYHQLLGTHDVFPPSRLLRRLDLLGHLQLHHRLLPLRRRFRTRHQRGHAFVVRCQLPIVCHPDVREVEP